MASTPKDEEFSWTKYMETDGSLPAYDQSLFPQLRCSERRLSELILRPGRKIIIRRGDRLEYAKIEIVFESKLYVTLNSGFECIDIDDVMPDNVLRINGNRLKVENEGVLSMPESNESEELTAEDLELAHLTMAEAIKVGQYFELQDRIDPCKVFIAQVFENRGGLLLVGRNGTKPDVNRPIRVFFTDERCHAIGWLESGAQTKLHFVDGTEEVIEAARENPVTHLVFEHFRVREHKFQENMSLEVLQASNGGAFYAGHVIEINNSHYFTVRIAESLNGMEKTITCSKSHPQIFPSGWCQRHGLRLTPPSDYVGGEEFSMLVYEAKLQLKGKAPESLFDPPKTLYKPERLRNVEILDLRTKNEMYPAKILRWMKHIVWITYGHYSNATPPGVLSTRCGLIFPCGFAQQHGIRLCKPCVFNKLEPVALSVDRFGFQKTCTTHKTPVFIKAEKRFMPAVYLENDLILPVVYFKKNCFCGPFLDPGKVKALPDQYPSGPMPAVIRLILADIINAAYRPEDLKYMENLIVFVLNAVRKFLSFANNPFMRSEKHAWTANYQGMSTPPRKNRLEGASVSRPSVSSRRRKKIGKPEFPEPRRPVTRAVLRKTIRSPKSDEKKILLQSPKKDKSSSAEPGKSNKALELLRSASRLSHLPITLTKTTGRLTDSLKAEALPKKNLSSAGIKVTEEAAVVKKLGKNLQAGPSTLVTHDEKVVRRKRRLHVPDSTTGTMPVPIAPKPLVLSRTANPKTMQEMLVNEEFLVTTSNSKSSFPAQGKKAMVQVSRAESSEPIRMPQVLTNPITWNCAQLSAWLKQTDLGAFADLLAKDEVDGEAFMLLSLDECINTLKIKLGPAMKLESLRKGLRNYYETYFLNQ